MYGIQDRSNNASVATVQIPVAERVAERMNPFLFFFPQLQMVENKNKKRTVFDEPMKSQAKNMVNDIPKQTNKKESGEQGVRHYSR